MLRPLAAHEGVSFPVHDDGRLLDQRQPLLHPVLERGARGGAQLLSVLAQAVTRGERDQGHRLTPGLAQPGEDLPTPAAPGRVDRRAREHDRPNVLGRPHGKLRDDLAAHRVRDERGPLETDLVHPGAK